MYIQDTVPIILNSSSKEAIDKPFLQEKLFNFRFLQYSCYFMEKYICKKMKKLNYLENVSTKNTRNCRRMDASR